ncbi:hypothetical protein CAC42_7403 [Sphaceloma murrayae]|uniref:Uncharacterized protein n=1 Tax=Sphaceloma murrayae TaxID=2082308 RepID=A0A2K1QX23_9PEZI|nr:hypothetical protein CAC42_7403 [Sphaceloma murrayae]
MKSNIQVGIRYTRPVEHTAEKILSGVNKTSHPISPNKNRLNRAYKGSPFSSRPLSSASRTAVPSASACAAAGTKVKHSATLVAAASTSPISSAYPTDTSPRRRLVRATRAQILHPHFYSDIVLLKFTRVKGEVARAIDGKLSNVFSVYFKDVRSTYKQKAESHKAAACFQRQLEYARQQTEQEFRETGSRLQIEFEAKMAELEARHSQSLLAKEAELTTKIEEAEAAKATAQKKEEELEAKLKQVEERYTQSPPAKEAELTTRIAEAESAKLAALSKEAELEKRLTAEIAEAKAAKTAALKSEEEFRLEKQRADDSLQTLNKNLSRKLQELKSKDKAHRARETEWKKKVEQMKNDHREAMSNQSRRIDVQVKVAKQSLQDLANEQVNEYKSHLDSKFKQMTAARDQNETILRQRLEVAESAAMMMESNNKTNALLEDKLRVANTTIDALTTERDSAMAEINRITTLISGNRMNKAVVKANGQANNMCTGREAADRGLRPGQVDIDEKAVERQVSDEELSKREWLREAKITESDVPVYTSKQWNHYMRQHSIEKTSLTEKLNAAKASSDEAKVENDKLQARYDALLAESRDLRACYAESKRVSDMHNNASIDELMSTLKSTNVVANPNDDSDMAKDTPVKKFQSTQLQFDIKPLTMDGAHAMTAHAKRQRIQAEHDAREKTKGKRAVKRSVTDGVKKHQSRRVAPRARSVREVGKIVEDDDDDDNDKNQVGNRGFRAQFKGFSNAAPTAATGQSSSIQGNMSNVLPAPSNP